MPTNDYANSPNLSRSEEIIQSILDGTEYDEPARSRIEYLLKELKEAIEGGGGGGGVTSYSPLTEKPKIDNHTLQAGNNSSSNLGLQTKLTFDSAPTESSTNPVTSGGVYTALGAKANSSDVYNKSAVDTALTAKADKTTTYTKTEVDTALSSKQNTISDLSTIRSGAALGATAVQPVSGKGLSTNDYTNDEKSKLAGIEAQANKTTVDSALSGTSTNPVQNKVVKSALDGKQASLTTAQLAAVNSGIDSADVTQITTNKNNISKDEAALVELVDAGAKNKLSIGTPTSVPTGLTCTRNTDGTYTVSGTLATANSISFSINAIEGDLVLSGCPEGGGNNTYLLRITKSGSQVTGSVDTGNGSDVFTMNGTGYALNIRFAAGTYTNVIFSPMICTKADWDISQSYQPYALSNVELTVLSAKDRTSLVELVDGGAKNHINNTLTSGTIPYGNISYTVNTDKSITIKGGTATANADIVIPFSVNTSGTYVLTGGALGGGAETYKAQIALYPSMANVVGLFDNTYAETALSTGTDYAFRFRVYPGQTVPDCTIYPMICTKAAWDISHEYQPYRPSYQELYEMVKTLQAQLSNQ